MEQVIKSVNQIRRTNNILKIIWVSKATVIQLNLQCILLVIGVLDLLCVTFYFRCVQEPTGQCLTIWESMEFQKRSNLDRGNTFFLPSKVNV